MMKFKELLYKFKKALFKSNDADADADEENKKIEEIWNKLFRK